MHKYLISLLLLLLLQGLGAESEAARIGNRDYSSKEINDGFEAYLSYKHIPYTLTAEDSLQLFEQYFDELIAMYIYDSAIQSGKITVSREELELFVRKNPPLGVQGIAELRSDGRFDHQKYQQALAQRPAFKEEIMDYSKDMYSYRKLLDSIKNEITEADLEVESLRNAYLREGGSADARIIHFDYTRYRDLVADEDEVYALYLEVRDDEYRKENGRSLDFVRFTGPTSRAAADPETQAKALQSARILYELALEHGLSEAAQTLGYEVQESQMFTLSDPFIRGIGREKELITKSFEEPLGSIFEPYTGMMGDILVCSPAREAQSFYEDYNAYKSILQFRANSRKRADYNHSYVQEFIRKHTPQTYLEAAQRDSIPILDIDDIHLDSSFAPIGQVPALNRAILSTPQNEFTPLIEDEGMYFLALVQERETRTMQDWEEHRQEVLAEALAEAQSRHLDAWYLAEKAKLEIIAPSILRSN